MPEAITTQRIYEKMYIDIACGKYQNQEDLPSISNLCEHFSVGRNTMRSVLRKLEEDGFIKQEKGRNAWVIFDSRDPKYFRIFQEAMYGRFPALIEIFQVMEDIMPELIEEALRNATAENIEEIKRRIQRLKTDTLASSYELLDILMSIYLYAFSLLDNQHVIHLFTEMMEFVTIIAPKETLRSSEVKRTVHFLGQMMSTIMEFVLRHEAKMMKKAVKIMIRSISKQVQRYIRNHVDDQIEFHPIPFRWMYHPDYLYQHIVIDILNDINLGKYEEKKDLPTFEQLAEQYHVSVRTSRKAIDVLNRYHVVHTVNGVGSFICVDDKDKLEICRNDEILSHVKDYCEVLQLLRLCIRGIGVHYMQQWNKDQVEDLILSMNEGITPNLTPLMKCMFTQNSCLTSIYQEAVKDFSWHVYVQSIYPMNKDIYDFIEAFQLLEEELRGRKWSKAAQQIDEIMGQICKYTNEVYLYMKHQSTNECM